MKIQKSHEETVEVLKQILKSEDYATIANETGYTENYVRQIVRGYVKPNQRSQVIIDKAVDLANNRITNLQKEIK